MPSIKVELLGDSTSLERAFLRGAKASGQLKVGLGGVIKTAAAITGITVGIRALSNVLTSSVTAAGDFQLALQKTVGLSGVAQSAIAGLRSDVLKLAPAVGKGPQELADALFFITSSGIPAAKALDVLTVSAKASAAGLGETQVVADAVTSALNAYGPAVLNATQATDVLVATVREGKGEADQFAGVIGNVAALAAQLGVSFNEVGAALAAQTRLGTDAETSATQLQRVFTTLLKVTPASAKAFAAVGLNADKLRSDLGSKGLLNVLEQVKAAFPKDPKLLAKAFGDQRAIRGVLALVGKQADSVRGIFDRLGQSTGSLGKAFGAVSKTQAQQFAKLNASLDTFKITLGAALAPAILKVIGPLNKWLSVSKNQKKVQDDIRAAVKNVVQTVRDLKDALTPLVQTTADVVRKLGGLKEVLKGIAAVLVVSKIVNYSAAIAGIGVESEKAAAKAKALRTQLALLATIGVITIGVEILINRETIDKKVRGFLRGHHLGFLAGGGGFKLPATMDLEGLEALRQKLIDIGKAGDPQVEVLDKIIAKLRIIKAESIKEPGEGRLGGPGGKASAPRPIVPDPTVSIQKSKEVGKKAGEAARAAFERAMARLDIDFSRAQQTTSLQDDLRVLQQTEKVLLARIAIKKNDLDLQKQLVDLQGQELDLQKQIAANQRDATKAKQFKALGLTSTGEALTPGAGSLLHRAKSLREQIKGTILDTPKTRSELAKIVAFLKSHLKTAGKEVRQAILNMLNDISGAADQKKGPLTKTSSLNSKKILEGLGLSADQERQVKARLSNFNSAGVALANAQAPGTSGGQFVVHTTVNLDGQKVASNTTKHQQKSRRRNPQQKRGPHRR